ncbi:hypothetical protein ACMFMF_008999 [Clarireedia jacksonii]
MTSASSLDILVKFKLRDPKEPSGSFSRRRSTSAGSQISSHSEEEVSDEANSEHERIQEECSHEQFLEEVLEKVWKEKPTEEKDTKLAFTNKGKVSNGDDGSKNRKFGKKSCSGINQLEMIWWDEGQLESQ